MRRASRSWLFALLALVIAVCVVALSARFGFTVDWSAGQRATITQDSRALLEQLAGPLEAVAYARPGPTRAKTSLLIERYHRFKPDLHLRFVDPDLDPVATQDAGVKADGEIVLHWHNRTEHVTRLDEPAFSDALARLARGNAPMVAFVTGDGERAATGQDPADLGGFVDRLAARGVRVVPLNLAEAAEVPRNAALVVLASPQAVLPPDSVRKLEDYLAEGGNLLWLTEPGTDDLGLAAVANTLGIKRLPGTLFDPRDVRDPRTLVATAYPQQAPTDGFTVNTVFAHTTALAALSGAAWNALPILQSSRQSWARVAPSDPAHATPGTERPEAGELKGPLTFGYALSRLSPSPDKRQQRAVVIGDGDFLSNAYVADAGNLAFGERLVDWLLGDDALASMPPVAPDRVLKPDSTGLAALAFGYLLALPVLLILTGFWIGWRRRRR